MDWTSALAIMIGLVVGAMAIGIPVAFSFLIADIIGVTLFMGGSIGIVQLVRNSMSSITSFALVPVPLFLIMGELFFHTGLGTRMFSALDKTLGRLPGRLSFLTIGGGTLFAALSGSSMASTALLGSLMVPEMTRRGYKKSMAIGPILGTGGLAILIPPSALAVLLGSLARIDIGALLLAGIIPGLILATMYAIYILARVMFDPASAPAYAVEAVPLITKIRLIITDVIPMGIVVFLVIGLIILGWATPTESAAFGVAGVFILAVLYRGLSLRAVTLALSGSIRVTVMAFMIILGSITFSQILAFSGASSGLINWATSVKTTPLVILLVMFMILLILGMFMDQLSMMMLTVPIFFPLAKLYGYDPIWLGVVVLLSLEISFTTPPFGLLLFIMKGVAPPETKMTEIWTAALPYMGCAILLVFLLVAWPEIALWLPGLGN